MTRTFVEAEVIHRDNAHTDMMLLFSKTSREFFLVKIVMNGVLRDD